MLLNLCLFGFVISASLAAPTVTPSASSSSTPEPVPILSAESDVDPSGNYKYSYESGDGSKAEQSGELREVEKGKFGEAIHGSYEYTAPDGQVVSVSYTADENGYQAQGNVLPQVPEIPEAIARALKFIEEHPEQSEDVTPKVK